MGHVQLRPAPVPVGNISAPVSQVIAFFDNHAVELSRLVEAIGREDLGKALDEAIAAVTGAAPNAEQAACVVSALRDALAEVRVAELDEVATKTSALWDPYGRYQPKPSSAQSALSVYAGVSLRRRLSRDRPTPTKGTQTPLAIFGAPLTTLDVPPKQPSVRFDRPIQRVVVTQEAVPMRERGLQLIVRHRLNVRILEDRAYAEKIPFFEGYLVHFVDLRSGPARGNS
jgi:hypothetical protein